MDRDNTSIDIKRRIATLNSFIPKKSDKNRVTVALTQAAGNWISARTGLQGELQPATLAKLDLAHGLADWSGDNLHLVKTLSADKKVSSLRDVALHYDVGKLEKLVDAKSVPDMIAGATAAEKKRNFAVELNTRLFHLETSAVLERMANAHELPIDNDAVRANVARVLGNTGDLDIRTSSVYTLLEHPYAFRGVPEEVRGEVVGQLKTLQRVQALSPTPEVVPAMMKAGLTSALQVSDMPETTFTQAYAETLGGEANARHVHAQALNVRIRNEHALMSMRETTRGTGLAVIDGNSTRAQRIESFQHKYRKQTDSSPLNLDALFGSNDLCECDECLSVYSPASYFVELLNYLRNNNLEPGQQKTDPKDISDTPLEVLFRRRPDLGCLELTCENAFTVLPYIDLVNEVMESFVVHLGEYTADTHEPRQATLDVFNVEGETTGELLAQPQHVNEEAYCILKNAVYPFTLPYHQPIDTTRIFLDYLGSSREELQDTFRTAHECATDSASLTNSQRADLQTQHDTLLNRAVDAEALGMTQEEYIILTREAFWPRHYFEITSGTSVSEDTYRQKIGVRPVSAYYGYDTDADMLSIDEAAQRGLTFVKKQFLPRTGLAYTDLIDLLKTRFINPDFPQGKALTLLESIRFSYRFLMTLVDTSAASPTKRYAKLVAFLTKTQHIVPLLDALLHPDPCHAPPASAFCDESKDLEKWVHCYFERIGKLIVLDAGEAPRLPVSGNLYTQDNHNTLVGSLLDDGRITAPDGKKLLAHVDMTGRVLDPTGKPFSAPWRPLAARRRERHRVDVGDDHARGVLVGPDYKTPIRWTPARDTCDLDKVRLVHLTAAHWWTTNTIACSASSASGGA